MDSMKRWTMISLAEYAMKTGNRAERRYTASNLPWGDDDEINSCANVEEIISTLNTLETS